MVHVMRVAFNHSGFLHREPRRRRLCISIKLLDEGARWLLLLFFCRYCLLSAPLPKNVPPPALLPETAQRPPAGRSAEQIYLGSPRPRFPRKPLLFVPPRRVSLEPRDAATPRNTPQHPASPRAVATKVHCPSSHTHGHSEEPGGCRGNACGR